MKHICVSTGILILILIFCLFSANYTTRLVRETSAMLEAAQDARRAGDEQDALRLVQAASSHWERHEAYFGTVLRHSEIDTILTEFSRLEAYARSQKTVDFYSSCGALVRQLEHVEEMEWPSAQNIL